MVADIDAAISYIFTWETSHDERVCPQCGSLNGKEYHGQDLFQHTLTDPVFGSIWDLDADRSLMHGGRGTCRCQIAVCVKIDWSQLSEFNKLSKRGLDVALYQRAPGTSIAELRGEVEDLKKTVVDTEKEVANLNRLWTTYLSLARKAGLPEDLVLLMSRIQQFRIAAQTAIKTIELLKIALISGGPVAWVLFLGSAALTGLMLADQFEMRRPRY